MTTLNFRRHYKADPTHMKVDFKINISANIVEFTFRILTTVLPSCKNNQKEVKHITNNLLVKTPSKGLAYSFLSPCFLERVNLPAVRQGDKQEPGSYHLVKHRSPAPRELNVENIYIYCIILLEDPCDIHSY